MRRADDSMEACLFICKHYEKLNDSYTEDEEDEFNRAIDKLQREKCCQCPIYAIGIMAGVWKSKDLSVKDLWR